VWAKDAADIVEINAGSLAGGSHMEPEDTLEFLAPLIAA
jgi:hypothetical protein